MRGNAYCNFGDGYELEEAEPDNVIYLAVKSPSKEKLKNQKECLLFEGKLSLQICNIS